MALTPQQILDQWARALQGEGIYNADVQGFRAQSAADAAARRQAIQALYTQYGGGTQGVNDIYGDLGAGGGFDPTLAARNPYSTMAQLAKARGENVGNMLADRSAAGTYASGGTTQAQIGIGNQYGLDTTNAANQFLAAVGGLQQQFATGEQQRMTDQQKALYDAQQRLVAAGFAPKEPAPASQTTVGGQMGQFGGPAGWANQRSPAPVAAPRRFPLYGTPANPRGGLRPAVPPFRPFKPSFGIPKVGIGL